MVSMIYGYARAITGDQAIDLRRDVLERTDCDRNFTGMTSGAKAHHSELDHMLDLLRGETPWRCGSWTVSTGACRI
ncbi:hypothetical protein [Bifidobacterium erythrocebi]|uniref:hypothetical protein n=1 Tax=Bifidobacterium erythrocebi TaxID=2675325 RepID=UPI00145C40CB|nr:hypothetical protein [Bifidobacterium sp. DSM 109960]